jgi:hypothetical protein
VNTWQKKKLNSFHPLIEALPLRVVTIFGVAQRDKGL